MVPRPTQWQQHSSGLSYSLPNELLAQIFIYWADIDEDGAWMASCVSQRWRRVVLSCSEVWCRIWVNLKPPAEEEDEAWCVEEEFDHYRGKRRPMDLWLERSGAAELFLVFQVGAIAPVGWAINDMLSILAPHSSRFREVTLQVDFCLLADALLELLWEHAPALTHIDIVCPTRVITDDKRTMDSLWVALDKAKSVRSLTCRGSLPPKINKTLQPSMLRILVLEDVTAPIVHFRDGLEACQFLEQLFIRRVELNTANIGFIPLPPPKIVILPALSLLHLEDCSSEKIMNLLDTPNLRTLRAQNLVPYGTLSNRLDLDGMRGVNAAMERFGGSLTVFIRRNGLELNTLYLNCSSIPDASLLQLLTSNRILQHLHLIDSFVGEPFALGIAQNMQGTDRPICPMLESITLESCPLLSGKTVIDLIRSRNSGPSPITSLTIGRCAMINAAHMQILRTIDPERLRVNVVPEIDS